MDEVSDRFDAEELRNLSVTHNFESEAIREVPELGGPVFNRQHGQSELWSKLQRWSSFIEFVIVFYLRFTDLGRYTELGIFTETFS